MSPYFTANPLLTRGRSGPVSRLGDQDVYFFNEGTNSRLYEKFGTHRLPDGGVYFAVWAPNAQYVSVIGDFNDWDKGRHPMLRARGSSGSGKDQRAGSRAKARITSFISPRAHNGYTADKIDPFGFMHGPAPLKESIVRRLNYTWADGDWMASRGKRQKLDQPMSIYEMHLGSWARAGGSQSLA